MQQICFYFLLRGTVPGPWLLAFDCWGLALGAWLLAFEILGMKISPKLLSLMVGFMFRQQC